MFLASHIGTTHFAPPELALYLRITVYKHCNPYGIGLC